MIRAGQILYNTRTQRSLSLEQIAEATKIKPRFLSAIEDGEYDKLPSPAYAKGFVRNYASYLGLSQKEVMALFRREFDEKKAIKVLPDGLTANNLTLPRIYIRKTFVAVGLILLILVGYLGFQYRAMLIPPSLSIDTPKANATTKDTITVTGTTDPNATVLVNNEPVSLSTEGKFSKELSLFPGKTSITVASKNRFGKETVMERNINVED